jgi:hypothetical protein
MDSFPALGTLIQAAVRRIVACLVEKGRARTRYAGSGRKGGAVRHATQHVFRRLDVVSFELTDLLVSFTDRLLQNRRSRQETW